MVDSFSSSLGRSRKRTTTIRDFVYNDVTDDIWELIISKVVRNSDDDRPLELLSLVSKSFLSITNRLKRTLGTHHSTARLKLLGRFPNLIQISLSGSVAEFDEIFLDLAKFHLPLQVIDLSGLTIFPSNSIVRLSPTTCSTVRSLILKKYRISINKRDLEIMVDLFPNLEELVLSPKYRTCKGLSDDDVDFLATKLHCLKSINLEDTCKLTDKSIISLSENCPHLELIVLNSFEFVTHFGLSLLLTRCTNLKSIGLGQINIGYALSTAKRLSMLDLYEVAIRDDVLLDIAKADLPLKRFSLIRCYDFSPAGILRFLEAYQFLDYLYLEGADCLTDKAMVKISDRLGSAKTVKLNDCKNLSSSTFFTLIKNCPVLETLEMADGSLMRVKFRGIDSAVNSQIRVVKISGCCYTLSKEFLYNIAIGCPNLEVLKINYSPFIPYGIMTSYFFSNCSGLRHVQIKGCGDWSDLQLGARSHQNLKVLKMDLARLDDEALFSVAKQCPELRHLEFKVTVCLGVTKKGMHEVVAKCVKLRTMQVEEKFGKIRTSWSYSFGESVLCSRRIFKSQLNENGF